MLIPSKENNKIYEGYYLIQKNNEEGRHAYLIQKNNEDACFRRKGQDPYVKVSHKTKLLTSLSLLGLNLNGNLCNRV